VDEIKLEQTKYDIGVALCWFAVITGLIGLVARIAFVADDYLWFSVVGVVVGGLGITFGPELKTVTYKTVKLSPVNHKEIK
jgi:hypothetical protein